MERAGLGVALAAVRMGARYGTRVLVLAGPGNNGGDAYVAARYLRRRGVAVEVRALGRPKGSSPAGKAADAAAAAGVPVRSLGAPEPCDLLIDGLFGAGFPGPADRAGGRLDRPLCPGAGGGPAQRPRRERRLGRRGGLHRPAHGHLPCPQVGPPLRGGARPLRGGGGGGHRPGGRRRGAAASARRGMPPSPPGPALPTSGRRGRCWWWAARRASPAPPSWPAGRPSTSGPATSASPAPGPCSRSWPPPTCR